MWMRVSPASLVHEKLAVFASCPKVKAFLIAFIVKFEQTV